MLSDQIKAGLLRERPTWIATEIAGFGVAQFKAQIPAISAFLGGAGATEAELEAVAELARRATDESADRVRDQHVVSRVILRRFCEPVGSAEKLAAHNLQWGASKLRTRTEVGKIVNFVKIDSATTEVLWQQVENGLHDALVALQEGRLFDDANHVLTVKRAITLHFARGREVGEFNERSWKDQLVQRREEFRGHHWLMRAALEHRYGPLILPAGRAAEEIALDLLMEGTVRLFECGTVFRLRVEDEFQRGERLAKGLGLRILEATGGEFLIGDTPVVVLGPGGQFGLREVGLAGAVTLALPLSPTHLAALHTSDEYVRIPPEAVEEWNRRQVLQATSHVYYRPGSSLAPFITATRLPTGRS